jgi:hypothetical protein
LTTAGQSGMEQVREEELDWFIFSSIS